MSTKTTFKRIALVTVAALGFGLLSVAPSSALPQADTLTLSATTSATGVGSTVSITVTQTFLGSNGDTMAVLAQVTAYPAGFAAVPVMTVSHNGIGGTAQVVSTVQSDLTDTATVGTVAEAKGAQKVSFTPTGVGTYVISFTPYRGTAANQLLGTAAVAPSAAVATWTITVTAVATTVGDTTSTSVLNTAGVTSGSTADTAVTVAAGSSTAAVATITVTPKAASVATTGSTLISATITGPGTLSAGSNLAAGATSSLKSVSFTSAQAGAAYVHVYGDGSVGTSTITVYVGGVLVGTETVAFSGASASAVATVVTPVITSGSGATATGAVTAIVKDSGGNVVSGATVYAVSGTTTVFASTSAATDATGKATFSFLGLTAGTSTVTVQNVAAGSTVGWSAAVVSVRAGSNVASSVTLSLDKATYTPGEAATVTVVIKDAAGNVVSDGSHTVFTAAGIISSRALSTSALPVAAALTTGSSSGTLTYAIHVPVTAGDFTISAAAGSAISGTLSVTANVGLSAAETAAAETAAAAVDAANEATDAANAALDAANAAAEAADAATAAAQDAADAVAALSVQVATLVASLKAQVRSLTNLVIRIQKKLTKMAKKK